MKKTVFPQDQNFWYLQRPDVAPLRSDKKTEIVVIGAGMAGLTAAHVFAKKGKKVIVLEAFYCGAGATGKSSGFITPNAELSLSEFVSRYGAQGGKAIWDTVTQLGVEHIRNTINQYQIDCDYLEADALEVASSAKDVKDILKEAEMLTKFGYESKFIKKEELPQLMGSDNYYGGVIYPNSFGINAYKYCQAMKNVLVAQGVEIYEETPVIRLEENRVTTLHANVQADSIIVCADRFIPTLGKLQQQVSHVQTFLMLSEVLAPDVVQQLFPQKPFMVWNTDLMYSYYRMSGGRLLVGGGSVLNAYNSNETHHSTYMYNKLTGFMDQLFPGLAVQFEQMWPGLIGISKDIAPLTGYDKDTKSIYYVGAAAGLPIAAMLGNYSAEHILDGADMLKDYFSPYRKFSIGGAVQTVLGNKVTFALSNFIAHGK